jgi:hypothetical protein
MADFRSRFRLIVVSTVAVSVLAGCGGEVRTDSQPTVAKAKLQTLAKEKLEAAAKQKAKSVICEDGIVGEVGATQRCVLTAKDGTKIGLTARVDGVEGRGADARVNIDFKVDDKPIEGHN